MTPSVNKIEITISKETPIQLYLRDVWLGTVRCTKPGTYEVDFTSTAAGRTYYAKFYGTPRQHNGMSYDAWTVWE